MPDRAYPKQGRKLNIHVAPAVPVYRLQLAARLAYSERQCRDQGKHKGRARRHLREVQTRQAAACLEGFRSGAERVSDGGGRSYSLAELLRGPLVGHPGWARSLQTHSRNLVTLAEKHGPASGWGIPQSAAREVGNPNWTPYFVPKAAERCWRWWRLPLFGVASPWAACSRPSSRANARFGSWRRSVQAGIRSWR